MRSSKYPDHQSQGDATLALAPRFSPSSRGLCHPASGERTTGVSPVQTPGRVSSPGAADSRGPSPKQTVFQPQLRALSPSPLKPGAIVSAVIYVKAFVGPLVLTVSVLSNGNNYGAFHPLFTGLLWGERGLA